MTGCCSSSTLKIRFLDILDQILSQVRITRGWQSIVNDGIYILPDILLRIRFRKFVGKHTSAASISGPSNFDLSSCNCFRYLIFQLCLQSCKKWAIICLVVSYSWCQLNEDKVQTLQGTPQEINVADCASLLELKLVRSLARGSYGGWTMGQWNKSWRVKSEY